MALLKKNDVIQAEIEGMTSEGSGVAHYEGMAVFVPHSAPGDVAELIIIKVTNSYAVGKIKTLIRKGDGRCEPDCPSYPQCGGCTFRHITYEAECRIKLGRVNDAVKRIGGVALEAEELIAADHPDRYRNKAQIPFGGGGERQCSAFTPSAATGSFPSPTVCFSRRYSARSLRQPPTF